MRRCLRYTSSLRSARATPVAPTPSRGRAACVDAQLAPHPKTIRKGAVSDLSQCEPKVTRAWWGLSDRQAFSVEHPETRLRGASSSGGTKPAARLGICDKSRCIAACTTYCRVPAVEPAVCACSVVYCAYTHTGAQPIYRTYTQPIAHIPKYISKCMTLLLWSSKFLSLGTRARFRPRITRALESTRACTRSISLTRTATVRHSVLGGDLVFGIGQRLAAAVVTLEPLDPRAARETVGVGVPHRSSRFAGQRHRAACIQFGQAGLDLK
jgi:hypothetical protein